MTEYHVADVAHGGPTLWRGRPDDPAPSGTPRYELDRMDVAFWPLLVAVLTDEAEASTVEILARALARHVALTQWGCIGGAMQERYRTRARVVLAELRSIGEGQ
jgi:hypothetical protein